MSQRQGPQQSEAAATLELLTLRGEISDLAVTEGRLNLQAQQLQSQLASYNELARQARESGIEHLASQALEHKAAAQAELAGIQERLARLVAQKATLTEQQQAAQQRLNAMRASILEESDSSLKQATAPVEKLQARRRGSRKPLMLLFSGLVILMLVGSLVRALHLSALDLSLLANTPSGPQAHAGPGEAPPFFTPAKTAPTNQGCLTTIRLFCYTPEDIQQAFHLTALYKQGFDGRGQTIVVIGAGETNTLAYDLHQFDLAWGLPDPPQFSILYPDGPPVADPCSGIQDSAQQEKNTQDVEWAHAIAPGANIMLMLGGASAASVNPQETCGQAALPGEIAYALKYHLGNILLISDSASELGTLGQTPDQHTAEQQFFTTTGHQALQQAANEHVTVLAGAGDGGSTNSNDLSTLDNYWPTPNVAWPASDPNVLAVGGTSLTLGNANDDDAYISESAWNVPQGGATGGGLSALFPEPDYQHSVQDQSIFQGQRGIPDVAFAANSLLIYQSFQQGALEKANPEWKSWDLAYGASVAAPCWAGLIAIADQMYGAPLGHIQPALYSLQGAGMHDITTGDNAFANVPGYQAQKGYDLVTGWGTPIADQFIPALLQATNDLTTNCGAAEQPIRHAVPSCSPTS